MNKQEFIKKSWAVAGFDWDQIKDMVNESGILQLKEPELKYSLTGYGTAYDHGLIKGLGFNHKGFMISLESLEGVDRNNGWTKIESPQDMPFCPGEYLFMFIDRRSRVEYHSADISIGGATHWRPIVHIPNPLY